MGLPVPRAADRALGLAEVDRCANLACPNRPGGGRFVAATTDEPVVGGHRPLVLIMCAPCAETLTRLVAGAAATS